MRKQIKVWDAEDKTAHAAPAQMGGFLAAFFKKMDRCCLQNPSEIQTLQKGKCPSDCPLKRYNPTTY